MNLSLREQLLKAGLVTEKQAKQAERSKSQQRHRQTKGDTRTPPPPEPVKSAQQAQAAKLLRDAEMNRKQREKAERKARAAELKQLVEQLRIPRPESDDWFNFVDGGKVHRVAVTPELRARIVSCAIAIVRSEGHYHLVPVDSLERIRERHPEAIVSLPAEPTSTDPAPDDPYKDFVVPDDLTW
jgi:uncharacterized protein YaiL (DUF2058 family)